MPVPLSKRLDLRLASSVGIGLLVLSVFAGFFAYRYAYQRQLELADSLQRQLVRTVQSQAEVAAFAANGEVARGVLDGLLANPIILAVRIESSDGFKRELGSRHDASFEQGKAYPLYSPVDHIERIGTLVVVQNDDQVGAEATHVAVLQTLLMLGLVMLAAISMAVFLRIKIIKPITRLAQAMGEILPGSASRLTVEAEHAADELGLLAQSANAILDATEAAIGEVKQQRDALERLATHDHLTGLPTMRLAQDRLEMACSNAIRNNGKVALLFIDIDDFKSINDTYGHEAGDDVLQEVAFRLRSIVRAEDTAARIGGDEFLVILGKLPQADASTRVAEEIETVLSWPIETHGHSLRIGASIGIALFPDHTGDVATLRRVADEAMYQVKRTGKGRFAMAEMHEASAVDSPPADS